MKKITAAALLAAITIFSFTGCNSNGKSADGYVLKMRMNKGDKFSQDYNMDMDMSINMAGMSKDVKMKVAADIDFNVLDSSTAGKQMKITYTKMSMSMDMGMPSVTAMTDSMMKKTSDGIVGKSVILTLAGNKVTDVQGMDSIIAAQQSDSLTRQTMEKMFSKDNFNNMFGMMFSLYPDHPVKEGDTWTGENKMDMNGVNMNVKTKYTLIRVKDGIAEVGVDGTIDSKGTMVQKGMSMDMDMTGTQKGKMNVKLADGYLQSGNYDMDIDASMSMMGQKIPMKMKASYTLKGN